MTKLRALALAIVAAHWIVAIWHLFLAARILPAPNDHVGGLAIVLISAGHLTVAIALWKLSNPIAGWVSSIFFLAALGADLYEHFLQAAPNNVFMVTRGEWTAWFVASVFALLALEIMGCSLGIWLLGGRKGTKVAGAPQSKSRQTRPGGFFRAAGAELDHSIWSSRWRISPARTSPGESTVA